MTDKQLQAYRKMAYQEREEVEREARELLNQDIVAATIIKDFDDPNHTPARFAELAQRAHTLDFVLETLNRMSRT